MAESTNTPARTAEARRAALKTNERSALLPDDTSAVDMYLALTEIIVGELKLSELSDDQLRYFADMMLIIESVPHLDALAPQLRRDVMGVFAIADNSRPDSMCEALYRQAAAIANRELELRADLTRGSRQRVAHGVRSLALAVESLVLDFLDKCEVASS